MAPVERGKCHKRSLYWLMTYGVVSQSALPETQSCNMLGETKMLHYVGEGVGRFMRWGRTSLGYMEE